MDAATRHDYLTLAKSAAGRAVAALERHWEEWRGIDSAHPHDLKIDGDRRAEDILIADLAAGGLPVLSEESGWVGAPAAVAGGAYWVADPLDGSVNYHAGNDLCCVALALCRDGRPLAGVVHRLGRDEVFEAVCGGAEGAGSARCGDRPLRVTIAGSRSEAVLGTSLSSRGDYSDGALEAFGRDLRDWRKVRILGSGSLSLAWVAAGRLDAYREARTMPWDILPGWALVEAAGGAVRTSARLPEPGQAALPLDVWAGNARLLAVVEGEAGDVPVSVSVPVLGPVSGAGAVGDPAPSGQGGEDRGTDPQGAFQG